MGVAYRKNMKNVFGKSDVTAREVLHVGKASIPATVAAAADAADAFGVSQYTCTRSARLDGLVADLSAPLSSGELAVDLLVNGVSKGSASFLPTASPSSLQVLLDKENGNEVYLASGDVVKVTYEVKSTLDASKSLSARVHLTMLE